MCQTPFFDALDSLRNAFVCRRVHYCVFRKADRYWVLPVLTLLWVCGVHFGPRLSPTNALHTVFGMLPTPVLLLPQIVCAIVFARHAFASRKTALSAVIAALCVAGCFGIITVNAPHERPPLTSSHIRALTLNVHLGTRECPQVLAFVKDNKVDLIFLQENFGEYESPASYLISKLPGWHSARRKGVAVLSKFPIVRTSFVDLNDTKFHALLSADLSVHGTRVRAISAHWSAPQSARGWNPIGQAAQNKLFELSQTLKTIGDSKLPTILAGDFNAPPRHHTIRQLEGKFESCFRARGSGTGWTYPNGLPMIQLDHMFAIGGIRTLEAEVTPKLGSDHRGLVCDLTLKS